MKERGNMLFRIRGGSSYALIVACLVHWSFSLPLMCKLSASTRALLLSSMLFVHMTCIKRGIYADCVVVCCLTLLLRYVPRTKPSTAVVANCCSLRCICHALFPPLFYGHFFLNGRTTSTSLVFELADRTAARQPAQRTNKCWTSLCMRYTWYQYIICTHASNTAAATWPTNTERRVLSRRWNCGV